MVRHEPFLRQIISNPEDRTRRLVYADWLDEQGHPFGELLRRDWDLPRISFLDHVAREGHLDYYLKVFPDLKEHLEERQANLRFRECLKNSGDEFPPDWLAIMDTLARPFQPFFFWNNSAPRSFKDDELPFDEHLGTRGTIVTFESAFRGEEVWDEKLIADLRFLTGLVLADCAYGAASCPMHPFICEWNQPLPFTARKVLASLKAREFQSDSIAELEATDIPFPGYHPGGTTFNDEVHTDPAQQHLFSNEEVDDFGSQDLHQALKGYVLGGKLWYVLLHSRLNSPDEEFPHPYVVLFAVGQSPHGDRLLGVISHQVCHNLCD